MRVMDHLQEDQVSVVVEVEEEAWIVAEVVEAGEEDHATRVHFMTVHLILTSKAHRLLQTPMLSPNHPATASNLRSGCLSSSFLLLSRNSSRNSPFRCHICRASNNQTLTSKCNKCSRCNRCNNKCHRCFQMRISILCF